MNGGKQQYGKSELQKLVLSDRPIPLPVKEKPKLPEPVVVKNETKTEPVIVLVEEPENSLSPAVLTLLISIAVVILAIIMTYFSCKKDRIEIDPDDELEKEQMREIVHTLFSDLIKGAID